MKAFPDMIVPAAKEAGIKVPSDLENFEPKQFPHWTVFSRMQLGQPMPYPTVDWDNARVVAKLNKEKVKKITPKQLIEAGFLIGFSH